MCRSVCAPPKRLVSAFRGVATKNNKGGSVGLENRLVCGGGVHMPVLTVPWFYIPEKTCQLGFHAMKYQMAGQTALFAGVR